MDSTQRLQALQQEEKALVDSADWFFVDQTVTVDILYPCNLVGPETEPNKDGYRFFLGGAPGVIHAYGGMYWSNSNCRQLIPTIRQIRKPTFKIICQFEDISFNW